MIASSSFPTHTLNFTPSGGRPHAGSAGVLTASSPHDAEPGSGASHSPWPSYFDPDGGVTQKCAGCGMPKVVGPTCLVCGAAA